MSNVVSPPQPIDGHTLIPNTVLHDASLSPKARMIYAYFASAAVDDTNELQIDLATRMGMSHGALEGGIEELVRAGYLTKERHPRGRGFKSWTYTLVGAQ